MLKPFYYTAALLLLWLQIIGNFDVREHPGSAERLAELTAGMPELKETVLLKGIPDSTKQRVDSITRDQALECACRVTVKVTDPDGNSHYSGFDGRKGERITDFKGTIEIGSCSKMFTATSILQLVEQKKLSLEDRLIDLIDDKTLLSGLMVTDSADYLGDVVLKQLVNHTSGLPEYFMDNDDEEIGVFGDSTLVFTPGQLVRLAKRLHEPQFKPGSRFKYTNTNYILLGMILEKYTGLTYQEYIRQNILNKAGLSNTYFPSEEVRKHRSPGHWNGRPSQMPPTLAGPAGEIISNLDDMDTFIREWGKGSFYREPSMMDTLRTAHFNPMGGGIGYGLGVINLFKSLGHGGQTFGYQSYMGFMPDKTSFVFGIDDASSSAWELAIILQGSLVPLE